MISSFLFLWTGQFPVFFSIASSFIRKEKEIKIASLRNENFHGILWLYDLWNALSLNKFLFLISVPLVIMKPEKFAGGPQGLTKRILLFCSWKCHLLMDRLSDHFQEKRRASSSKLLPWKLSFFNGWNKRKEKKHDLTFPSCPYGHIDRAHLPFLSFIH